MSGYRVVVAVEDAALLGVIKSLLSKAGYLITGEACDGLTALKLVRSREPDALVVEAFMPGMDGFEVARIVHEDRLAAVIMLVSAAEQKLIERAKASKVLALLAKSDLENNLVPALELSLANFQELTRLEDQIRELKESLEARKVIERAKGILMETLNISESEAYRRLQKQSMDKRISMKAVAEAIILAHNI